MQLCDNHNHRKRKCTSALLCDSSSSGTDAVNAVDAALHNYSQACKACRVHMEAREPEGARAPGASESALSSSNARLSNSDAAPTNAPLVLYDKATKTVPPSSKTPWDKNISIQTYRNLISRYAADICSLRFPALWSQLAGCAKELANTPIPSPTVVAEVEMVDVLDISGAVTITSQILRVDFLIVRKRKGKQRAIQTPSEAPPPRLRRRNWRRRTTNPRRRPDPPAPLASSSSSMSSSSIPFSFPTA